jgi:formylglycine-generating enzyme required for sulfatase activity
MWRTEKILTPKSAGPILYCILTFPLVFINFSCSTAEKEHPDMKNMILVNGGTFEMGDLFDEGSKDETPVHTVKISDYYIGKYEITIAEFGRFTDETGYETSAEGSANWEEQQRLMSEIMSVVKNGEADENVLNSYILKFLAYGGSFWWQSDRATFDFNPDYNWKNPGLEQSDNDPVVCISWNDAASYCNWLSQTEDLPPAYDVATGGLLDENGKRTDDITKVKGYRLPTEAEWEYAARERGRRVRFGNGRDVARSVEANFDAASGDFPYLEKGEFREKTVPVGSFIPNSLGLHDMAGNAWEWCSDYYASYTADDKSNPHRSSGLKRVIRDGRWGGDARAMRVSARAPYEPPNRCNNSGFRIARSASN